MAGDVTQLDENQSRLIGSGVQSRGLLGRVLTFALGAVLLVAAFMASLLLFAILLTGGLLVGGYLWWKTRDLRRRMREQMHEHIHERRPGGRVLEGEAVRDVDANDEARY